MNPVDDLHAAPAVRPEPVTSPDPTAGGVGSAFIAGGEEGDLPDEVEIAARLARVENKPPLYRLFRGALYTLYLAVALWLFLAIVISWGRAVWGDAADALRKQQDQPKPLEAAPAAIGHEEAP